MDDFTPKIRQAVQPIMDAGAGGVYAHGKWGVGKTHLAAAMTWELWPRLHGHMVRVRPLLNDIRRRYNHESGMTPDDFVNHYAEISMLSLDDLGAEYTTPWAVRTLFEIIEQRCHNADRQLTIITSNFTLDELAAAYDKMAPKAGSSIASRIAGMCLQNGRNGILAMGGRDRRVTP